MLDLSKPITVPILSGTQKLVKVMFPSDALWCERARNQRVVRQFLGRGKSQTDDDKNTDRLNHDLLAKIRSGPQDDPTLTPAEATLVIGKLERARVSSVDREGDTFRIVLRTALGEVTHVVGIPTAEQMLMHERQSTKTTEGRRNQEIRGFLEPSGELYNRIAKSTEGYAATAYVNTLSQSGGVSLEPGIAVPIVHKVAVVAELLAQINAEDDEELPEA
jgi:hypothetical protein